MPKDHRQAGALNFAAIKRALNKPRIYIATFLYICLIRAFLPRSIRRTKH